MPMPRIGPLADHELSEDARALLAFSVAEVGPGSEAQVFFRTLLRHPGLYRRFSPFAGKLLLKGRLPARARELAILRCAALCAAELEWNAHVPMARAAGLTEAEIRAVRDGSSAPVWTPGDAAVLRAAEELHAEARIGDATWAMLVVTYDEAQLIELPFLIGAYHMIAYAQNSLRGGPPHAGGNDEDATDG